MQRSNIIPESQELKDEIARREGHTLNEVCADDELFPISLGMPAAFNVGPEHWDWHGTLGEFKAFRKAAHWFHGRREHWAHEPCWCELFFNQRQIDGALFAAASRHNSLLRK